MCVCVHMKEGGLIIIQVSNHNIHEHFAMLTCYLDEVFDQFCSDFRPRFRDDCRHHPVHLIVRDLMMALSCHVTVT